MLKKLLPTRKIALVHIGTFKIKVSICEIKGDYFNIIGYSEKRQDKNTFEHGEISNIQSICESIKTTIKKACGGICLEPKEIVINYPSSYCFPELNKINYKRKNFGEKITEQEFSDIIEKAEKFSIKKAQRDIYNKTGFSDMDQRLIYSSINEINLDGSKITNPIGTNGENIEISILNIFSSQAKFNIIKSIGKILNKKILFIIPSEISLPKISENCNKTLFIDFGNSKTRIILSERGKNIGFNILEIGIEHLILKICERYGKTRQEVIHEFDSSNFENEKSIFLETWLEGLKLALKEINNLKDTPSDIVLTGGGGKNLFIQNLLLSKTFSKKIGNVKLCNIINKDVENKILEITKNNKIEVNTFLSQNISFSILGQIIATKEMLNSENDIVIETLKKVLEKIRY